MEFSSILILSIIVYTMLIENHRVEETNCNYFGTVLDAAYVQKQKTEIWKKIFNETI